MQIFFRTPRANSERIHLFRNSGEGFGTNRGVKHIVVLLAFMSMFYILLMASLRGTNSVFRDNYTLETRI